MFHAYVLNASKETVDFDRATYLMDKSILDDSVQAMRDEMTQNPRWDAAYDAQWIWEEYCLRHYRKYGEYFKPDVDASVL